MKILATFILLTAPMAAYAQTFDNATCIAQTTVFQGNTDLLGEYATMLSQIETNVTNNFLGFCNLLELSCTVDVSEYDDNYVAACEAASGQIVTKSKGASCSGAFGNAPVPEGLIFGIDNFPICVGQACDTAALPEEIETTIDETFNMILDEINSGLGGTITCQIVAGTTPSPDDSVTTDSGAAAETTTTSSPVETSSTMMSSTSSAYAVGAVGAVLGTAALVVMEM